MVNAVYSEKPLTRNVMSITNPSFTLDASKGAVNILLDLILIPVFYLSVTAGDVHDSETSIPSDERC